jgi:MFS family permease
MFLGNYFGTFFSYTFKIYGLHNKLSDNMLTWAGATASVANGLGRVLFGYLLDEIGFKKVVSFLFGLLLLVSLICTDAVHVPEIYFMTLVINIMAMGSMFAVMPAATLKCFGLKHGPYLYTIITTATLLTAVTNIGNASLIPHIHMRGVCLIGSLTLLIGFLVLYQFNEKPDWKPKVES